MQFLPFTDIKPLCVSRVQISAHGKNARSAEQIANLISPLVMGIWMVLENYQPYP